MNVYEILASPVVERLGWMLLHSIWQLALIALAVGLAMRLGRLSARVRYGVACLGMVAMVACPVATFFLVEVPESHEPIAAADYLAPPGIPQIESTSDAYSPPIADVDVTAETITAGRPVPLPTDSAEPVPEFPTLHARLAALAPWFVPPWLAGMLLLALWQLGGYYCTRRWITTAKPIEAEFLTGKLARLAERMSVKRTVRLLQSTRVATPLVLGWLRPAILLPVELITNLPAEHWDAVLAHELAHIRRYDYLVNLLQTAAETVLFYHPGVWMVSRWIRIERELCCDDIAADVCGSPIQYAEALTRLETYRHAFTVAQPHSAVAAVDGTSTLNRVRRLLGVSPKPKRGTARLAGVYAVAVVLAAVLAFAGGSAGDSRPAEDKDDAAAEQPVDPHAMVFLEGTVLDEGKPVPGAKVRVCRDGHDWSDAVVADARGRFRIPADKGTESAFGWSLLAESPDGSRRAFRSLHPEAVAVARRTDMSPHLREIDVDSLELPLEPTRETTVIVQTTKGGPISGARVWAVSMEIAFPGGTTGADGKVCLRLPSSLRISSVAAVKNGKGLDYFENYESRFSEPGGPLPESVTLALDEPVLVRLRVHDTSGRPVSGVFVHGLGLLKEGKRDRIRFGLGQIHTATDANGIAVFNCLPKAPEDAPNAYEFWIRDDWEVFREVFVGGLPGPIEEVEIARSRSVAIGGRVLSPDGKPAPAIRILANAQGLSGRHGDRLEAVSGADGTYRLTVTPGGVYSLAVVDPDWTAPVKFGIVPREGKPETGHDFHLGRGTVIRGRVTFEEDVKKSENHEPVLPTYVGWSMTGDPVTIDTEDGPREVTPSFARLIWLREGEGPYSFRVGPGKFSVSAERGSLKEDFPLVITDQTEVVRDFELIRPERFKLQVVAVQKDRPPKPMRGADVDVCLFSEENDLITDSGTGVLNDEGETVIHCEITPRDPAFIPTTRPPVKEKMFVVIRGRDQSKGLAGAAAVEPRARRVVVPLEPCVTLRGRVVGSDGSPAAPSGFAYSMVPNDWPHDSKWSPGRFPIQVNADGAFEIPGLPVGISVRLTMEAKTPQGTMHPILTETVLDRSGVIDLGDVNLEESDDEGPATRRPKPDTSDPDDANHQPPPENKKDETPNHATLRGKVVLPDGTPAAGAKISGFYQSLDNTVVPLNGPFEGLADENGAYRIALPPEVVYMLRAVGDELVTEMRQGVAPTKGGTATLEEMRLIRGTVIRGRLEYEGEPPEEARTGDGKRWLLLRWSGQGEPLNVKGTLVPPFFDGRVSLSEGDPFAIRVAPGEYKFHVFTSSLWKRATLRVTDEPEMILNFEERRPRTVDLHVVAFRGPPVRPVPGAWVRLGLYSDEEFLQDRNCYENRSLWGDRLPETPSNDQGELNVRCEIRTHSSDVPERTDPAPEDRMLVSAHATHEGEDLAGTTLVTPKSQTVFVPLKPAATVRGRLVDEAGKPISGARACCMFRQSLPMKDAFATGRGEISETGPDGRFEVTHLPMGLLLEVTASQGKGEKYTSRTLVQDRLIEEAGVIELGDVTWERP